MGTDGSSWLDRLQRRAQQRELEPGTTPGWAFAALSAGCASAAALACVWAPWRFGVAAMACFGGHWVGFAISELLKTNKWYAWGAGESGRPLKRVAFDAIADLAHIEGFIIWCVWCVLSVASRLESSNPRHCTGMPIQSVETQSRHLRAELPPRS